MLKLRIINKKNYLPIIRKVLKNPKIIILKDNNGKPYIKDSNICISISHSGKLTAIAISDQNIGIDMELIRPYDHKLLNHLNINSKLNDTNFFKEWTKREAFIKKYNLKLKDINQISINNEKFKCLKLKKYYISICK